MDRPEQEEMFILTNEMKLYGASGILSEEMLNLAVERAGQNFYILPSSVHECIIISNDTGRDIEILSEMVKEVNATLVEPKDRLTDSVYQYIDGKIVKVA